MTDAKPGDPTFPPMMTGVGVVSPDQPFAFAVAGARDKSLQAGHVAWARNTSVMDWAIVLEPDVPLAQALQMVPLALVAAGDCIGALAPPQVGLMFRWPNRIYVNGGFVGHIDVAASTLDSDAVPDWLVVRTFVQLKGAGLQEPGERPDITALEEEGCPDLTRSRLIESYSRHFLAWLNTWHDDGFHPVHSAWIGRAHGMNEAFSFDRSGSDPVGTFTGLDEDGNMLLKREDAGMSVLTLADTMLVREESA